MTNASTTKRTSMVSFRFAKDEAERLRRYCAATSQTTTEYLARQVRAALARDEQVLQIDKT